jgi:hypothetical protein
MVEAALWFPERLDFAHVSILGVTVRDAESGPIVMTKMGKSALSP